MSEEVGIVEWQLLKLRTSRRAWARAAFKLVRQLEFRILLFWFLFAGAVWSFLALGSEVGEGETAGIDGSIISHLRNASDPNIALGPVWFQDAMRDITALGGFSFLMLLSTVFVLCLAFHQKKREAIAFVVIALSSQMSIEIFKAFYDRPRPSPLNHLTPIHSASFPSGHTTESTAVFLMVATTLSSLETQTRVKALAFIVASVVILGVGFSRVYLGMHWPTDVFAGWFLGSAWALVGWFAIRRPFSQWPNQ